MGALAAEDEDAGFRSRLRKHLLSEFVQPSPPTKKNHTLGHTLNPKPFRSKGSILGFE